MKFDTVIVKVVVSAVPELGVTEICPTTGA
jgi:hypothetical protein